MTRLLNLALLFLSVVSLISFVSAGGSQGCQLNSDCPSGERCDQITKSCVNANSRRDSPFERRGGSQKCKDNSDCPSGERCEQIGLTCINANQPLRR